MPRQYPPHFRQEMVDRMLAGETDLALVAETGLPEQTLHRWKHQALVDEGLVDGVDSSVEKDQNSDVVDNKDFAEDTHRAPSPPEDAIGHSITGCR